MVPSSVGRLRQRSLISRIVHRYNKSRADHYITRATLLLDYYKTHDMDDSLRSNDGQALRASISDLKAAKRAYNRGKISSKELWRARHFVKRAIRQLHRTGEDHRTRLTEWMQGFVVPQYANTIQSLVYGGAGMLVVVVGLRGLGDLRPAGILPAALLDADGMLDSWIVVGGLVLELTMLLLLAVLYFFSPGEWIRMKYAEESTASDELLKPDPALSDQKGLTKEALQALIERKVDEIRTIERIQKML